MTDLNTPSFPTNQDLDPRRLRRALGIFPSGVVAVAAQVDGALTGLAASSFTSVSLDPPLVSFSIANASRTWPGLRRAAHRGVTIPADRHSSLARQLAGPPQSRFRRSESPDGMAVVDVPAPAPARGQLQPVVHGILRLDQAA
jgi:flavin reductase (DIM6/NTAB) family NADH-FMN oxidoreductase RutF